METAVNPVSTAAMKAILEYADFDVLLKRVETTLKNATTTTSDEQSSTTDLELLLLILDDVDKIQRLQNKEVISTIFSHLLILTGISSSEVASENSISDRDVHLASTALAKLYHALPLELQLNYIKNCIDKLESYDIDTDIHERNLLTVISVLSATSKYDASTESSKEKHSLYASLAEIVYKMFTVNEHLVGHIFARIVPVLFEMKCMDLEKVWQNIVDIYSKHKQPSFAAKSVDPLSERPLFLLCSMADWFFPVDGKFQLDFLTGSQFWDILQNGLWHIGTLTRKRALYLLKRILDICVSTEQKIDLMWDPKHKKEIMAVWEDFILLIEGLEEKQVHVIKPLMPRLQNLIRASYPNGGRWSLAGCWVTCLFERIMSHESSFIRRWGMLQLLDIDLARCPIMQHQPQFFREPFITMLSDSTLYHKPNDVPLGECAPLVKSLLTFFQRCVQSLPDQELANEFLRDVLCCMKDVFWSGAALVYIAEALANISPRPVWNASCVAHIRELIGATVRTMETHFRASIQEFLMRAALNLADVGRGFAMEEFVQLLVLLRHGESFALGCSLWAELSTWLRGASGTWRNFSLQDYVSQSIGQAVGAQTTGVLSSEDASGIVRVLLLAADIQHKDSKDPGEDPGEDPAAKDPPILETATQPILAVLTSMNSHSYMSRERAERAMMLLSVLLRETQPCSGCVEEYNWIQQSIQKWIASCSPEIILYIHRELAAVSKLEDLSRAEFYGDVLGNLSTLQDLSDLSQTRALVHHCLQVLANQQSQVTLRHQIQRVCCLRVLAVCLSLRPSSSSWKQEAYRAVIAMETEPHFAKPADLETDDSIGEKISWGRVTSDYLSELWRCISLSLDHCSAAGQASADHCLQTMDLVAGTALLPVFNAAQKLIPQCDLGTVRAMVDLGWARVQESAKAATHWEIFVAFVDMALQPRVLAADADSDLGCSLAKVIAAVFEAGQERRGIVLEVCRRVIDWWLETPSAPYAPWLSLLLSQAMTYGQVHSKGKRYIHEVHMYLLAQGDRLSVNQLCDTRGKDDHMVRVYALGILARRLRPDSARHGELGTALVRELMREHRAVQRARTYRCFPNSQSHRHKHRIVSALVLLERFAWKDAAAFHNYLVTELVHENQQSVRCVLEWMLIRLYHLGAPDMTDELWTLLKESANKKPVFVCSLMTVTGHLAKLITSPQLKVAFLRRALPFVIAWSMSHHFNTRTYAQATLVSLWQHERNGGGGDGGGVNVKEYSGVQTFIDMWIDTPNITKTTQKLLDNFFFTFHPIRDYSMETLVWTLPYLTQISDEEWLPLGDFERISGPWGTQGEGCTGIPLMNGNDELRKCEPGTWRIKYTDDGTDGSEEVTEGDVQKKIIPWRSMLPSQELEPELLEDLERKQEQEQGLVLVTSLIDKIPNLGGLCRSSEIFGVSEFVVGSLRHTKEKAFENLSVTAHKWIPIKEVQPHLLSIYLMEMKQEGYTLVGAEQTANSKCLTQYSFPQKTLLLLGNEKEGIPVELIQLLDVCVEIPQRGVVRSLNVHVCGALLIWEYTRQHLIAT